MEKTVLIFIFILSLFLKISNAAGAERTSVAQENNTDPKTSGELGTQPVVPSPESSPTIILQKPTSSKTETRSTEEKMTTIHNSIHVAPNQVSQPMNNNNYPGTTPFVATKGESNNEVGSVLGTTQKESFTQPISIAPLIGSTAYTGSWYNHVRNNYTLGLLLEIPATSRFSIEIEGIFARSNIAYVGFSHDFNQYSIGSNGKIYLSRGMLQPYVGVGFTALCYENMSYGPSLAFSRYSRWMGASQAIAGIEVEITQHTALGIRGQWVLPTVNRPGVQGNGAAAAPLFEEASLMNTTFFRVMGSARLAF